MQSEHPFSLTHGGPFYHVLRRLRLLDRTGAMRFRRLAALVWTPFAVLSLVQWVIRGRVDPMFLDPTVHVRFLIVLPLLALAENLLDVRCAMVAAHVRAEG